MKKNAHLHIVLETDFLNSLKEDAKKKCIPLSELWTELNLKSTN